MIRVPVAWIEGFDLRRSLAVIAVVGGGYGCLVWRTWERGGSPFGLLAAAPLVAVVLAPPLIALLPNDLGWVRERIWTPWQGRCHAFDDRQIRVVEVRGVPWFSSRDVHAALGLARRASVLQAMRPTERRDDPGAGEVLSLAGLTRLLHRRTDRTPLRLLAWAERDVCRMAQRRRDARMPAVSTPAPAVAGRRPGDEARRP